VLAYGLLNWNERRIRRDRFKRSRVFEIRHVGAAIEQLDAELASEAESGSGVAAVRDDALHRDERRARLSPDLLDAELSRSEGSRPPISVMCPPISVTCVGFTRPAAFSPSAPNPRTHARTSPTRCHSPSVLDGTVRGGTERNRANRHRTSAATRCPDCSGGSRCRTVRGCRRRGRG